VLFDLLVKTVIYLKMCFFKDLENFSWERVITEMKKRVPDVLDVLAAIAVPNVKVNSEQQSAPLCTAYGILMFTRWKQLSLIQKINTIVLSVGHATERTTKRLNREGVTVTRETYRGIMDDIGSDLTERACFNWMYAKVVL